MTGYLTVWVPGLYQLAVESDDDSRVFLDGQMVLDNPGEHPMLRAKVNLWLGVGRHLYEVEYTQRGGEAGLRLLLSRPWGKLRPLSPQLLTPPVQPIERNEAKIWGGRVTWYTALASSLVLWGLLLILGGLWICRSRWDYAVLAVFTFCLIANWPGNLNNLASAEGVRQPLAEGVGNSLPPALSYIWPGLIDFSSSPQNMLTLLALVFILSHLLVFQSLNRWPHTTAASSSNANLSTRMEVTRKPLLNPLTGLRGVAAYSVLVAHSISVAFLFNGTNIYQPLAARIGSFGISLFFVLSGFIIYYNYANQLRSEGMIVGGYKFFVARFARLYPLYGLVLLCSLDSIPSAYFKDREFGVFAYITLTQSWFDLQNIAFAPAWTISTEWFFYFAFLVMFPLLNKARQPMYILVIFLATVFIYMPNFMEYMLSIKSIKLSPGWVTYFSPYTRIFEFISGVMAAMAYSTMQNNQRKLSIIGLVGMLTCIAWCVAVIAVDTFVSGRYSIIAFNFIFAPAIAPLLIYCCSYDTVISRFLSSRVLISMGDISYSVYLLQFWMLSGISASYVLKQEPSIANLDPMIKIAIAMTLTTMFAYGSYHLFEKPCRAWIRKFLTPRVRIQVVPRDS
jgi:peptidoglycan/LPS O-acetylase OafA/YrhL